MICSYPVEVDLVNGDIIDAYVVITRYEPYLPATRLAPEEGGVYDWYFSLEEYGSPVVLDATKECEAAIEKYMSDDVKEHCGDE